MAITIKKQETVNHMLYGLTFTLNQYSNTRPTFSIHNNNELTTILTSDHLIPVSYTHLDVYKRQIVKYTA